MLNSNIQIPNINIALVHDSFTQLGGAERVIEAFHEMFPSAPVFTLVLDKKLKNKYKNWDIRTSWLQIIYNFIPKLQYLLPLIPLATSSLDFSGYDIVLSSSSSFVKNVYVPKNTKHINFCHTPTRFLWSDPEYVNQEVVKVFRPFVKLVLYWLKKWDFNGSQRVTKYIANSKEVQSRILKYYKRDSSVIYPFVDSDFWKPVANKGVNFLLVGRLQPHKNNEFVINVFNKLNIPLTIIGTGRQESYLKSIAKSNISFLGRVTDEQLKVEYSKALAVIYPQIEDFGLVPLEASLCGTPTIAYAKGGALETVIEGVTGEFFTSLNENDLVEKLVKYNIHKYSSEQLFVHAKTFSKEIFINAIIQELKI